MNDQTQTTIHPMNLSQSVAKLVPQLQIEVAGHSDEFDRGDLLQHAVLCIMKPEVLLAGALRSKGGRKRDALETKRFRCQQLLHFYGGASELVEPREFCRFAVNLALGQLRIARERDNRVRARLVHEPMTDDRTLAAATISEEPRPELGRKVLDAIGQLKPSQKHHLFAGLLRRNFPQQDAASLFGSDIDHPAVAKLLEEYAAADAQNEKARGSVREEIANAAKAVRGGNKASANAGNRLNKRYSLARKQVLRGLGQVGLLWLIAGAVFALALSAVESVTVKHTTQKLESKTGSQALIVSQQCRTDDPAMPVRDPLASGSKDDAVFLLASQQCRVDSDQPQIRRIA